MGSEMCIRDRLGPARRAQADYRAALHLMRPKFDEWVPRVLLASALNSHGLEDIWRQVQAFWASLREAGTLRTLRARQSVAWMWSEVEEGLKAAFLESSDVASIIDKIEQDVAKGEKPAGQAANELLKAFRRS